MNAMLKTIKEEIKDQATHIRAAKDSIRKTGKVIGVESAKIASLQARTYTYEIAEHGPEMTDGRKRKVDAVAHLARLQGGTHTMSKDNRFLQLVYAFLRNVPYSCVETPSYENRILDGQYNSNNYRFTKLAQLYDPSITEKELTTWLKGGNGRVKPVEAPANFVVI